MKTVEKFSYREKIEERNAALGVTVFIYSADGLPDVEVGVRLPRGEQTPDQVAQLHAPLGFWHEVLNPVTAPAAPMGGSVSSVAPAAATFVPQQPLTTGTTSL